jgi:hypothetical protein
MLSLLKPSLQPTAQELTPAHSCPPPRSTHCVLLGSIERARGTERLRQVRDNQPNCGGRKKKPTHSLSLATLSSEENWLIVKAFTGRK